MAELRTEMKLFFRYAFNTALAAGFVTAMVLLLPGIFGIRPYVVYSGSMEPGIPTGAVVFSREEDFSPKEGDIITFRVNDTVVTHRVIENRNGICTTKGDDNKTADPVSVEQSQIIGRVVFCLPYLGYVIHFLRARIPFTAVVIAACLAVIADLAYTPNKENKEIAGRN